jgi:hypothetical protein
MATKKKLLDLDGLLDEIESEVDEEIASERMQQLSAEDQILSQIATDILRLERDMTKPGQAVQDSTRIERLAKFIDETSF